MLLMLLMLLIILLLLVLLALRSREVRRSEEKLMRTVVPNPVSRGPF